MYRLGGGGAGGGSYFSSASCAFTGCNHHSCSHHLALVSCLLCPPLLPARSSNSPCSLSVPFHRASQPYLAPRLDVLSPELTLLPHFEFLFKVQFATFLAALQLSFLWLRNLRSQSTHSLGLARTQLTADRGEDCAKDRRQLRKNAALPLFSSSPAQRCSTRRHARPNHSK